jgi:hypothetical protein
MAKRPTECPGLAIGQFFDRGQDGYAILFHSRPEVGPRERLSVLRLRKDRVESHTVGEWALKPGEPVAVIWKAGPEKYLSPDGSKEIQTTRDAVALELIQEGARLYYWNGRRFQKLTISE